MTSCTDLRNGDCDVTRIGGKQHRVVGLGDFTEGGNVLFCHLQGDCLLPELKTSSAQITVGAMLFVTSREFPPGRRTMRQQWARATQIGREKGRGKGDIDREAHCSGRLPLLELKHKHCGRRPETPRKNI